MKTTCLISKYPNENSWKTVKKSKLFLKNTYGIAGELKRFITAIEAGQDSLFLMNRGDIKNVWNSDFYTTVFFSTA